MGLLAQVSIWEAVTAIIILITSFYLIFKPQPIPLEKETSNLFIISRDFLQSLSNLNSSYTFFTNFSYFNETLIEFLLKNESYIPYYSTQNLIKEQIYVAANCSDNEIDNFVKWFNRIKFNKREVKIFFVKSTLSSIPETTDLLIICGYKNLTDYKNNLISYISKDKGIVGFFDFPQTVDEATKQIFGLNMAQSVPGDIFVNNATTVDDPNFLAYKYFYNIPLPVKASYYNSSTQDYLGNFTFRNYTVGFEINTTSKEAYFYLPSKLVVKERQSFSLYGYSFFLSYLENDTLFISIKKPYNFTNFTLTDVQLIDYNESKIFLFKISTPKVPVAVFNGTKVAWIANFNRYNNATDDQKLALLSLLLAVSNKKFSYGVLVRNPVLIPFVDVESYDVYEPYFVNFGLNLPF